MTEQPVSLYLDLLDLIQRDLVARNAIASTPAPNCCPPAVRQAVSSAPPIAPKQPSGMTRQLS
jgi:hypothetical protein